MALKDWFSSQKKQPTTRYASIVGTSFTGILLLAAGVALFATLIELWPVVDRPPAPGADAAPAPGADRAQEASAKVGATLFFGIHKGSFDLSTGLFLLAIVAGALGAYIHAATSFVSFVGNRTFKSSWQWWYGLRLPIGGALALVLYFAFRGGLLPGYDAAAEINPYGIAAISAFAGLFSKQATDKLKEVFDVFFRTPSDEGDGSRKDKLDERRPEIVKFEPPELTVGDTALKIIGDRFEKKAKVFVEGKERPATFVDSRALTVALDVADTARAGSLAVSVTNPSPGEPTSDVKTIKVVAPGTG
jgi:hypothetical protein